MSETMRKIEELVPADLDVERLVRLAPAMWRDWGLLVVLPEQMVEAEQHAALETLGEALYGIRRPISEVRVGDAVASPGGALWEALSVSDGRLLARRVADGALASFHQPGGKGA